MLVVAVAHCHTAQVSNCGPLRSPGRIGRAVAMVSYSRVRRSPTEPSQQQGVMVSPYVFEKTICSKCLSGVSSAYSNVTELVLHRFYPFFHFRIGWNIFGRFPCVTSHFRIIFEKDFCFHVLTVNFKHTGVASVLPLGFRRSGTPP